VPATFGGGRGGCCGTLLVASTCAAGASTNLPASYRREAAKAAPNWPTPTSRTGERGRRPASASSPATYSAEPCREGASACSGLPTVDALSTPQRVEGRYLRCTLSPQPAPTNGPGRGSGGGEAVARRSRLPTDRASRGSLHDGRLPYSVGICPTNRSGSSLGSRSEILEPLQSVGITGSEVRPQGFLDSTEKPRSPRCCAGRGPLLGGPLNVVGGVCFPWGETRPIPNGRRWEHAYGKGDPRIFHISTLLGASATPPS